MTVIFLVVLALAASISQLIRDAAPLFLLLRLPAHFLLTVGFASLLFLLFQKLSSQKKLYANTLIASLIMFLVLAPPDGWVEAGLIAFATLIMMAIKFFAVRKGRPLVNPAAGGIFLVLIAAALFFPDAFFMPSWWGASFLKLFEFNDIPVNLSLFLIWFWIIVGLKPWRKYPMLLAFLLANLFTFGALLLSQPDGQISASFLLYIYFDSTIYFFASVMLIEPKTSPSRKAEQYVFGAMAGILFALFYSFSTNLFPFSLLTDYHDLSALLLVDLLFVAYSLTREYSRKSAPPPGEDSSKIL